MADGLVVVFPPIGIFRHPEELARARAEAKRMIQEEIMQLVWADKVLRLLRDLAVLVRGQKLRGDRRVENVQQDRLQGGRAARCLILHDVAHERLRHRAVDGVHGHMVAVVGRPAERELRQIAGADHEATGLVGNVHQNLRALARLAVFIGHVVHRFVMADVGEVLPDGGGNVDLLHADAQLLAKLHGIGLRALRGAEAGHRDALDLLPAAPAEVERAHAHEKRERAVEPAGDAEHDGLRVRMLDPLFKALRLDAQDRLRTGAELLVIGRDEGIGRDGARQLRPSQGLVEDDLPQAGDGGIARGAMPLVHEPLHVDLGDRQLSVGKRLVFREDGAVFRDQMVAGEDHILRGLRRGGAAVDIAAGQPRGRRADQHPAVVRLADHLVRGGQVGNDGRAAGREAGRRRARDPEVLAQLDAEGIVRQLRAGKKQIRAERHALAAERQVIDVSAEHRRGRKLPLLVKFAVVRQVRLRHHTEEPARVDDRRAVIELAAETQRQTHGEDRGKRRRLLKNAGKRRLHRAEQAVGEKQVAAGVAGQAQLRQRQQVDAGRVRLPYAREDRIGIGLHIRDLHIDRPGRSLDKPISHESLLLIL